MTKRITRNPNHTPPKLVDVNSSTPNTDKKEFSVFFKTLLGRRFNRVLAEWARYALEAKPILITGESGSGKSSCAELIHQLSPRAKHPVLRWGCGEIDLEFANASLFGYKKGAFTGAEEDHMGLLSAASKGSLILDDIDYLPLDVQSKLLRFLDNGTFNQLGDSEITYTSDARLIITTNKDLFALANEDKFLVDLIYRIRSLWIEMPSLRKVDGGLSSLAQHLLEDQSSERGMKLTFTPDALEVISKFQFAGNFRELIDLIDVICIHHLDDTDEIDAHALLERVSSHVYGSPQLIGLNSKQNREQNIIEALRITDRRARLAAKVVGCAPNTVYSIARKHNINVKR